MVEVVRAAIQKAPTGERAVTFPLAMFTARRLADGRKSNGSRPKLDADQRARLLAALKQRPPGGGLWSGPKVAAFVRQEWDVEVCPQTGWKWLVDLGFTLQVPRPSHPKAADPAARKRWKKTYASG